MISRRAFVGRLATGGTLAAGAYYVLAGRDALQGSSPHDVREYGARGDGTTDDTPAFRAAIESAAAAGGGTVRAPAMPRPYLVAGISLRSGVQLEMDADTVLMAPAGLGRNTPVLSVHDVERVAITGGTIDGSRDLQRPGEHRHGISIRGGHDVTVRAVQVMNCAGDGFYIGSTAGRGWSSHVRIEDCAADRNRRQGLSLVSGDDVRIQRVRLTNTRGTAPQAGLCIEPNDPRERLSGIRIIDVVTAGNAGGGILLALHRLRAESAPIDIEIVRHRSTGDHMGMRTARMPHSTPGQVVVREPHYVRPALHGFLARNWSAQGPTLRLIEPLVVDANLSGIQSERYGSAIAVYKSGDDPAEPAVIGNIHIIAPRVLESTEAVGVSWAFYLRNDVDHAAMERVRLEDAVIDGLPPERMLLRGEGVTVSDARTP